MIRYYVSMSERNYPRRRPIHHDASKFDTVKLVGGEVLRTHLPAVCAEQTCSVHNPSDHHMKAWRQHWRADRRFMERLCPHGIGHPDPDHMAFLKTILDPDEYEGQGVHGCDSCCAPITTTTVQSS